MKSTIVDAKDKLNEKSVILIFLSIAFLKIY